mgnify:FL=1|jgi:hypothetical protein|tara:strand:- start:73 stop:294 length:222 start_codon:yes stop_codon:yes gene_type:complete
MKIFQTSFYSEEGKEYAGPNVHAESTDQAKKLAELNNLILRGELEDIKEITPSFEDELQEIIDNLYISERVLH